MELVIVDPAAIHMDVVQARMGSWNDERALDDMSHGTGAIAMTVL